MNCIRAIDLAAHCSQ